MSLGSMDSAAGQTEVPFRPLPVVVLDPGHGGQDPGARGSGGSLEKDITLLLARKIAETLGTNYRVILTRSGDYTVEPVERASIANHADAEVFISLHTSASFLPAKTGAAVYHYAPHPEEPTGEAGASISETPFEIKFLPWEQLQIRHLAQSRSLALEVQKGLQGLQAQSPVDLRGAPLLALQGVDTPAVLVEVGHLTHPSEESRLRQEAYIEQLAAAISGGIRYFLRVR
jgi:N-acetylmuramoyl-L-alanine amidase